MATLSVALVMSLSVSPVAAFAASASTEAELSEAQTKIEAATSAYDEAQQKLDELQQQIDQNESNIASIEAQIPAKKEKASAAMREMYKSQGNSNSLISLLVSSRSLSDFIRANAYSDSINETNLAAVQELNDLEADLEQQQLELKEAKSDLEEEQAAAEEALEEAQALRSEAQAKAQAELEAELASMASDTSSAGGTGVSGSNGSSSATDAGQSIDANANGVSTGDVDFSIGYDAFMSTWTARIDNYLAGSPLAGYGAAFAQASWDTGVDPRWSPAISCIESTKGTYCANTCNAWGWSSGNGGWRSFGSWDEAIAAHVRYLGSMYGSTVTPAAAQTYCPPTWQDWFNKVTSEMARI